MSTESGSNAGKLLSIVIPVLNEQPALAELHKEIDAVAAANGYEVEVIFVDDGSTDGSWDEIRRLAAIDGSVQGIRFRRNFGKAAALSAPRRRRCSPVRGSILMTSAPAIAMRKVAYGPL
jgi:dolichol-phosphate mannosyltransferase